LHIPGPRARQRRDRRLRIQQDRLAMQLLHPVLGSERENLLLSVPATALPRQPVLGHKIVLLPLQGTSHLPDPTMRVPANLQSKNLQLHVPEKRLPAPVALSRQQILRLRLVQMQVHEPEALLSRPVLRPEEVRLRLQEGQMPKVLLPGSVLMCLRFAQKSLPKR
jgi:hypothetical protein